ncbi:MAG: response regulator transcription factor [Alphaproteobacteria bacterium]|nr:response regulator transcription factor [Alphaproteobacteria bacterium]
MIRVLVADDHPIVRHGLRRLINLQDDMEVVGEAADGAEVVRLLEVCPCEVIVLDLSLPHLRGLELVYLIRERHPKLRILVFSVQPEDRLSLHLLEAGVAGYLNKDHGVDAVIEGIRTVAAGRRFLTERLQELLFQRRDEGEQAPHERLSLRERQVFDRLVQGMSVSAIASELEISASTASNHLSRIRDKLGVEHNGEVLVYAARAGLL